MIENDKHIIGNDQNTLKSRLGHIKYDEAYILKLSLTLLELRSEQTYDMLMVLFVIVKFASPAFLKCKVVLKLFYNGDLTILHPFTAFVTTVESFSSKPDYTFKEFDTSVLLFFLMLRFIIYTR